MHSTQGTTTTDQGSVCKANYCFWILSHNNTSKSNCLGEEGKGKAYIGWEIVVEGRKYNIDWGH